MKIGAQYYTIRDFCQTLEDFDSSCKKVAEIGYKYVQLSRIGNFEATDLKPILDKYGLKVVCTHRPAGNYLENIEKEIEFHKTLECNICGLGAMPGFNAEKETIRSFVESFKPACEKLKEYGLIFAYHNHAFEFSKLDGKYVFDIIVNDLSCDNFKYILDVYWLAYAGIDPAKFIRKNNGVIACVHFKDLKVIGNDPKFAPVGDGNLDWEDIVTACEESGVEYALVEQDICEKDPFLCLEDSYNYLLKKGFI
jgi:sugar phosphate isomerase/epimerase